MNTRAKCRKMRTEQRTFLRTEAVAKLSEEGVVRGHEIHSLLFCHYVYFVSICSYLAYVK